MESKLLLRTEDGGWLRVEPLLDEDEALRRVSDSDRRYAATLTSPARRRELLSWRALLYEELGPVAISYAPYGAPMLPEGVGFIGVSHSRERVAVRYSPKAPCALDIEGAERNFQRVVQRYLTPEEQRLSDHPAYLCIAWCAKESLYKLAQRRELELLRDLTLAAIHFDSAESGTISARLLERLYTLHFCRIGSDWLVWY